MVRLRDAALIGEFHLNVQAQLIGSRESRLRRTPTVKPVVVDTISTPDAHKLQPEGLIHRSIARNREQGTIILTAQKRRPPVHDNLSPGGLEAAQPAGDAQAIAHPFCPGHGLRLHGDPQQGRMERIPAGHIGGYDQSGLYRLFTLVEQRTHFNSGNLKRTFLTDYLCLEREATSAAPARIVHNHGCQLDRALPPGQPKMDRFVVIWVGHISRRKVGIRLDVTNVDGLTHLQLHTPDNAVPVCLGALIYLMTRSDWRQLGVVDQNRDRVHTRR